MEENQNELRQGKSIDDTVFRLSKYIVDTMIEKILTGAMYLDLNNNLYVQS